MGEYNESHGALTSLVEVRAHEDRHARRLRFRVRVGAMLKVTERFRDRVGDRVRFEPMTTGTRGARWSTEHHRVISLRRDASHHSL